MNLFRFFIFSFLATLSAFAQPTRPKDMTAASSPAADDKILIDGATNGVRALDSAYYRSASNLNAGTLPDGRFPATLPAASGVNLTALNATQLMSGTVPVARLPVATTSANGAVTLAGSTNAVTGTSTALVPSVSDAAYMVDLGMGYDGGLRFNLPGVTKPDIREEMFTFTSGTTTGVNSRQSFYVGKQQNIWRYTEDMTYAGYGTTNATLSTSNTVSVNGITLTKFVSSNFYGQLGSNINGLGITPFTVGKRYLLSCYVLNVTDRDQFVWMRQLADSSAYGHGPKLIPSNRMVRIWTLAQALTTSTLDLCANPSVALGSGSASNAIWLFSASCDGSAGGDNSLNLYVGGFQIEQTSDTAKDGIAIIGDSTVQGASDVIDVNGAREWSGYLAAITNAPVYNRGIGGNKTADMVARWSTDITPLAATAKYVIIQGGINDIANSVAIATIKSNITSMYNSAVSDGLIPIVATCTPFNSVSLSLSVTDPIRKALNTWIKQTFPRVIDIAKIVEDPFDSTSLRRQTGWIGDGTHYGVEAKKAIAAYVSRQVFWDLPRPSPYQSITAATYSPPASTTAVQFNISNGAQLDAVGALTGTGVVARTGTNTFTVRSITGTSGQVTVTNGDGVSGAPTISLPSTLTPSFTLSGTNTHSGVNTFSNATNSTSTSTGAVVVSAGGLAVTSGDTYLGGKLVLPNGSSNTNALWWGTNSWIYQNAAGQVTFMGHAAAPTFTINGDGSQNQEVVLSLQPQGSGSAAFKIINSPTSGTSGLGAGVHFLIGGGEYMNYTTSGLNIYATTDASSTVTGAIQSRGGLGVVKKSYFGDTMTVSQGKTLAVTSGSNSLAGTVTLTAGAGTITSTAIDANTVIVLTLKTVGGTVGGQPYVDTITAGTGCTLTGGGASNTSTYNWVAFKVN